MYVGEKVATAATGEEDFTEGGGCGLEDFTGWGGRMGGGEEGD